MAYVATSGPEARPGTGVLPGESAHHVSLPAPRQGNWFGPSSTEVVNSVTNEGVAQAAPSVFICSKMCYIVKSVGRIQ